MVTGIREGLELVPPGIPGFRKPVQQQDKRSLTGLGDIEFDPVGGDPAFGDARPAHAATFFCTSAPGRTSPQASLVQAMPPPTITVSTPWESRT